ncbi:disulfide bond formation protein B [Vibrio mediterranei]|uniref:disulfide bond formation protein B n=1 Tax=Vibrio mediterranei TaxID=689 RepID=UPI00148DAE53|nr:disulfide bond formation protein B [Vibrio mediterranei]NOH27250.1 disulfide bond formation protein B [Vibrio mediterranei]
MNQKNITLLNTLGLLGITFVLLMGSVLQVAWNELPCPLCLLQRIGFVMVMFGFLLNIVYGTEQRHYGVILVGALFGAATALRQVSLHVIPGTPVFGSPILGMHYYTWAFVIFAMTIAGVALLLVLWNKDWSDEHYQMNMFGRVVCILAIVAVAINVLSTFIECGPYQCPDNPVSYWLLDSFK